MKHALVYVNRGRWVVDCPSDECMGAGGRWAYLALDTVGEPRYFHRCTGDHTGPGCGTPFSLLWPALDEAEAIIEELRHRSSVETRNWRPGETVECLVKENTDHLVGRDLAWLAEQGIGVV